MAIATPSILDPDGLSVGRLDHVDWSTYCSLRDDPAHNHLRMDYLDGTLDIRTPDPIHEEAADLLALVVRGTAAGCGVAVKGLRSTTLRRGRAPAKGSGKDPDNAFYLGPHVGPMTSFRKLRKAGPGRKLDLDVDRPPDLAIEVDHSRDSAGSLPIYARLEVPEVWRYDVDGDSLRFFRREGEGYAEVARSVVLPRLTPSLVLRALDLLDAMPEYDEAAYFDQVRAWARALPSHLPKIFRKEIDPISPTIL